MLVANIFQPLIDVANSVLQFLHDDVGLVYGTAIVVLTFITRALILPLSVKQIRSMREMSAIQPLLKEVQEKYKDDRERLQREQMQLFKEHGVNPFASCLPLLLQLPVFLALFRLLRSDEFKSKVQDSATQGWLFINDLTEKATGTPLLILMILYVGSQMGASLVMSVSADKTQQRIMLLLPLAFAAIIPSFPTGLIVYWITTNFWTFGQQWVVRKVAPPPHLAAASAPLVAGGGNGEEGESRAGPARKPPPPPRKRKKRRR